MTREETIRFAEYAQIMAEGKSTWERALKYGIERWNHRAGEEDKHEFL